MKPPPPAPPAQPAQPQLAPSRVSLHGTPPIAKTSVSQLSHQFSSKPPYTEKPNKTTFLNINSAQRRSTIGPAKRSFSSSDRRKLNLKPSSTLNKPQPNASTTSPLHKKRKSANLNKIQQSAQEVELYMKLLNEEREQRLNRSIDRSSMSEPDELSSPIKRNTLHVHRTTVELDAISDDEKKKRNVVEHEDEDAILLENRDSKRTPGTVENIEFGRRDVIDTERDFGIGGNDLPNDKNLREAAAAAAAAAEADHGNDNSSDSDLEVLGDNFSREPSQTLTHNQLTKLMSELKLDRFSTKTPDRMTEPQPQRPHPHHIKPSTVGNDQEDTILSPLRHDIEAVNEFQDEFQDGNELEDEPTMNFLDSPNSRSSFSLAYIEKLQSDNERKVIQLNEEIKERDLRINQLHEELAKQQEIEHKLNHTQELNDLQLRQLEHNVASLNKRNKILESSNLNFKRKLIDYKITVNEMEESNRVLTEKNDVLKNKLSKLQDEHSQMQKEHIEFTLKVDDFETVKSRLVNEKQELLDKLANMEREYETRIDHLEENIKLLELSDNEMKVANSELKSQIELLKSRNEDLQKEKSNLLATNDENQELMKELDHLISTTRENYENEIGQLKAKHEKETLELSTEVRHLLNSEARNKELVTDLSRKIEVKTEQIESLELQLKSQTTDFDNLKSETHHLESKLALLQNVEADKNRIESELIDLKNKYETEISDKESEIYNLTTKHSSSQNEIQQLKSTITDLKSQCDSHSQTITKQASDIFTYKTEIDKLLNAITALKQDLTNKESQVTQLHQDLESLKIDQQRDLKLQEDKLVKYLHHEYAQKHTTKMNEFKMYYEQELKNRDLTIKKLNRDGDFLLKNLEILRQKYNELLGEKAERSES